jgi:hypothetical protein
MPKKRRETHIASKSKQSTSSLSLKLETTDPSNPNVDANEFFATAEKWLQALRTFAQEQGQEVRWEIVGLQKSSALVQVRPVKIKTRKPAADLVRTWDAGVKRIERTGKPAPKFTPESLAALREFVFSVPEDVVVYMGNGKGRLPITAFTQRRVEEATIQFSEPARTEYTAHGSIRGRLAVLNSWNPEERSFRLQLPLAPTRPVRCTYRDSSLVAELGEGFEGMVEITGQLHYKPEQPWPYAAEVERIRVLPRETKVRMKDLVGLVSLPKGLDSVSYVRSLRDAE